MQSSNQNLLRQRILLLKGFWLGLQYPTRIKSRKISRCCTQIKGIQLHLWNHLWASCGAKQWCSPKEITSFPFNLGVRLCPYPPAVCCVDTRQVFANFCFSDSFPNPKVVRNANTSYVSEQRIYQHQRFICMHVLITFELANITDCGCLAVWAENIVSLL